MKKWDIQRFTITNSGDAVKINFLMPKQYRKLTGILIVSDSNYAIPMHGNIDLKVDNVEVFPAYFDSSLITASYIIARDTAKFPVDYQAEGRRITGNYTDIADTVTSANYPYTFSLLTEYEE
jgi:hypothetical protein